MIEFLINSIIISSALIGSGLPDGPEVGEADHRRLRETHRSTGSD